MVKQKNKKGICTPAYLYFIISIISYFLIGVQNIGNENTYCVGLYKCNTENTLGVFIVNLLYILFWTWVLDTLCRAGYMSLSWFLFLLPFVLMFVLIAIFIISNGGGPDNTPKEVTMVNVEKYDGSSVPI